MTSTLGAVPKLEPATDKKKSRSKLSFKDRVSKLRTSIRYHERVIERLRQREQTMVREETAAAEARLAEVKRATTE